MPLGWADLSLCKIIGIRICSLRDASDVRACITASLLKVEIFSPAFLIYHYK
jgi:hypothetical protein